MAASNDGPEAEYVKGPASIAVENRAGIVKAPKLTIPHTPTNEAGQTIPVFEVAKRSLSAAELQAGGAA